MEIVTELKLDVTFIESGENVGELPMKAESQKELEKLIKLMLNADDVHVTSVQTFRNEGRKR